MRMLRVPEIHHLRLHLADAPATEQLGAALAACLPQAGLVSLAGPLGAGKTTLTRGVLRALGHAGRVRSPSYSLLERYELGARCVLHLDVYRIGDPAELEYLGLREQMDARTLLLVEWAERAGSALPLALLHIALDYDGSGRSVSLAASGPSGKSLLERIASSAGTEQCQLTSGLHDENACQ
jgi:tRNA threonylcarbamoyladenosine biosynthesis protein TsaE